MISQFWYSTEVMPPCFGSTIYWLFTMYSTWWWYWLRMTSHFQILGPFLDQSWSLTLLSIDRNQCCSTFIITINWFRLRSSIYWYLSTTAFEFLKTYLFDVLYIFVISWISFISYCFLTLIFNKSYNFSLFMSTWFTPENQ